MQSEPRLKQPSGIPRLSALTRESIPGSGVQPTMLESFQASQLARNSLLARNLNTPVRSSNNPLAPTSEMKRMSLGGRKSNSIRASTNRRYFVLAFPDCNNERLTQFPSDKNRDHRPLRDKNYQLSLISRLYSYLSSQRYTYLSEKQLLEPTTKQFHDLFVFLAGKMTREKFVIKKKFEEEVLDFLRTFK